MPAPLVQDVVAPGDAARLRALDDYELLRRGERRDLRALVALAAQVCDVPMATLNLITVDEQHQIATVGFTGSVSDRADSMCSAVLDDDEPVILEDASLDDRFRDNPWVTGDAHVRFYATHQLITPDDIAIGTLCVFDSEPRAITEEQSDALADLAARVVDVLELELQTRQLATTVRRLSETELELRRSNAELAQFAARVSHDLRSPLAAILGNQELLRDELREDDADPAGAARRRLLLTRAHDAAARMSGLVEGMLAYAAEGARRGDGPVDLDAVLTQLRTDLDVELRGATLTADPLPVVRGDELQLRVLLQNLISNALKFTHPGTAPRVTVSATTSALGWTLRVVDHGIGLGETDPRTLLEPYRRSDNAGRIAGLGLGLATCKKIVDAHGGTLTLSTTPGGGTTVTVELPRP